MLEGGQWKSNMLHVFFPTICNFFWSPTQFTWLSELKRRGACTLSVIQTDWKQIIKEFLQISGF
jgi:hypothetical protein